MEIKFPVEIILVQHFFKPGEKAVDSGRLDTRHGEADLKGEPHNIWVYTGLGKSRFAVVSP